MDQANFHRSTATFTRSLPELNQADLELAGGKGANLAVLVNAGFPVPPGFCLTTRAYRAFVVDNKLEGVIRELLAPARLDDPNSLATVSTHIRTCFETGQIPPLVATEICQAYRRLAQEVEVGETPDLSIRLAVAVRSSATTEDLPDMSFAGQQDTYLNIVGEAA
jgi:pyruvate,water dikinase